MQITDIVKACGHTLTPKPTCTGEHLHGPWCLAIEDPYCTVGRCWGWYCSAGWSIHHGYGAPVEAIISDLFSALVLDWGYEPRHEASEGQCTRTGVDILGPRTTREQIENSRRRFIAKKQEIIDKCLSTR